MDRSKAEHSSRLLRPQEVADFLGVPKATLYGWRYRGEGPPGIRIGRHLRYRAADVDTWIGDLLRDDAAAQRSGFFS
jgi:excisionase family DNA binding protein